MIRTLFTKAQGAGNDFIIIEGGPQSPPPPAEWRRRICDRHYGVGADGILFLTMPTGHPGADADLRIFNSDGGEVEISGNGTRCAAAYLAHTSRVGSEMLIHTGAGPKRLRIVSRRENRFEFEMDMGAPVLAAAKIPFRPPSEPVPEPVVGFELPLVGGPQKVTVTSMGNPHCSILVDDFEWDWKAMGAIIEKHAYFPNRTNVEFCRVLSENEIDVRFWERGVGVTLSSGTGSCGAAVAAILNARVKSPVTVRTLAETLGVRWEGGEVILKGPAEIVFSGEYLAPE